MTPERILVVRTSALGDIVHCLPALAALRRVLPESEIGWVVEEGFAPLLEGHADLAAVVPVATQRWRLAPFARGTWREIARFRRALRDFRADLVLDWMGNHKAGVIARLTGCRRRLGAAREDRREPSSAAWLTETTPVKGLHAVDRAMEIVAAVGPAPQAGEVDLGGDRLLPDIGATDPAVPILIQPGAGWGNKRYPVERWGAVAAQLGEATGLEVGHNRR